jgi:hypothetical protein
MNEDMDAAAIRSIHWLLRGRAANRRAWPKRTAAAQIGFSPALPSAVVQVDSRSFIRLTEP